MWCMNPTKLSHSETCIPTLLRLIWILKKHITPCLRKHRFSERAFCLKIIINWHITKMYKTGPGIFLKRFKCKYDKKLQKEVSQLADEKWPCYLNLLKLKPTRRDLPLGWSLFSKRKLHFGVFCRSASARISPLLNHVARILPNCFAVRYFFVF